MKAQIRAGDRGKAGGVKIATSIAAVRDTAAEMIGESLVTPQTGAAGEKVKCVYVEQACDVARELYLGMLVDRSTSRVTLIASADGGVEIEDVAAKAPEKIQRVAIDPATGLQKDQLGKLTSSFGLAGEQNGIAERVMRGMYDAFTALDASLIEINPLAITGSGELLALDAKMSIDDNALFRHQQLAELRDAAEEDPSRMERERHGFNYVKLEGNVGCLVTGAGLALATLDLIKEYGGEPANFLDLPPVATRVQVAEAFKLILADTDVEGVLVNAVGGGLTRCDVIAEGMTTVAREMDIRVPLVVRFAGTNWEMGKSLLESSRMRITYAANLADAAAKVVNAVKGSA